MIDTKLRNLKLMLLLTSIVLIFGMINLTAQTPSGTTLKNQGKLNYQEPGRNEPVEGKTNEYVRRVTTVGKTVKTG